MTNENGTHHSQITQEEVMEPYIEHTRTVSTAPLTVTIIPATVDHPCCFYRCPKTAVFAIRTQDISERYCAKHLACGVAVTADLQAVIFPGNDVPEPHCEPDKHSGDFSVRIMEVLIKEIASNDD